jgi:hypothetical protein
MCYTPARDLEGAFMKRDPITGEVFLRVVGRRSRPPVGAPPSEEAQRAHASLLAYRTRAPKGIFFYRSHEEMEADRLRWTVEAMIERAKHG